MIIADRTLLFSSSELQSKIEVRVLVYQPMLSKEVDGFFECSIDFTGPISRSEQVYGLDTFQALSLALFAVTNYLRTLESKGSLFLENGEDYSTKDDLGFIRDVSDMSDDLLNDQ